MKTYMEVRQMSQQEINREQEKINEEQTNINFDLDQQIQDINKKLTRIGDRLDTVVDWRHRFDIVETRLVNLEKAMEALREIKERIARIEATILKTAQETKPS